MELVFLIVCIAFAMVVGIAALVFKLSLKVIGWLAGAACTVVLLAFTLAQWLALG